MRRCRRDTRTPRRPSRGHGNTIAGVPRPGHHTGQAPAGGGGDRSVATSVSAQLPGLGPRTLAEIPENARQVVVVTGEGKNSPRSRRWCCTGAPSSGWEPGATWPAHNALKGWTDDHHAGDLRSPIGVFALTDAGGLLADPGTKLPYDQSGSFTIGGTGFEGEPLAGSFDYVVAINYNRKAGTSPSTGPARSARTRAAASGCTSTTAAPPTAA